MGIHVLREILLWSIATRRQLDRWEGCVAEIALLGFAREKLPGYLVWKATTERHLVFVTARNMVIALDLAEAGVIEPHLKKTLRVVRDLHEHWDDYMPIYNSAPHGEIPTEGFRAGQWYSGNHEGSPFSAWAWSSQYGPKLSQNMPASDLRDALDAVDHWVIEHDAAFAEYIPPANPSPWYGPKWGRDQWWPKSPRL